MLTRIYGTAFHSKQDLADHLERLEQARARDHRKLGRELGLFTFSELSPGSAFWLPRGTAVYNALVARSREMSLERGYKEIKTPLLYDAELWKISGHWDKYRENMFVTESEDKPMGLKPMNCPGHCAFYAMGKHSYRELPIRYAEPGLLHRNEPSGTLHGLLRVRHFIQDDAHIFCTYDQIEQEVLACLEFGFAWYDTFGFDMRIELSTRPEQRIGSEENWDRAEAALAAALEKGGYEYDLHEGDGAFYGPKIDLHMRDSLNRSWQLGTVQLDFTFPERFDLTYTGADNAEHQPAMIHRALVGSFERFIGILLEHTAASCRCGWRRPRPRCCRSPTATTTTPARWPRSCGPAGCAPRSTTARSRSVARSARPSCARCPTCSWSATARPRSAPCRCAATARATSGSLPLGEAVDAAGGRGRGRERGARALGGLRSSASRCCPPPPRAPPRKIVVKDSCNGDLACSKYAAGSPGAGRHLPRRDRRGQPGRGSARTGDIVTISDPGADDRGRGRRAWPSTRTRVGLHGKAPAPRGSRASTPSWGTATTRWTIDGGARHHDDDRRRRRQRRAVGRAGRGHARGRARRRPARRPRRAATT